MRNVPEESTRDFLECFVFAFAAFCVFAYLWIAVDLSRGNWRGEDRLEDAEEFLKKRSSTWSKEAQTCHAKTRRLPVQAEVENGSNRMPCCIAGSIASSCRWSKPAEMLRDLFRMDCSF